MFDEIKFQNVNIFTSKFLFIVSFSISEGIRISQNAGTKASIIMTLIKHDIFYIWSDQNLFLSQNADTKRNCHYDINKTRDSLNVFIFTFHCTCNIQSHMESLTFKCVLFVHTDNIQPISLQACIFVNHAFS